MSEGPINRASAIRLSFLTLRGLRTDASERNSNTGLGQVIRVENLERDLEAALERVEFIVT